MMMLLLFPCVILFLTWVFFVIIHVFFVSDDAAALYSWEDSWQIANESFLNAAPWVVGVCLVWFLIAYYSNTSIIHAATGSYTLERRDNKRVYNLVENLCMANGLPMPKINVIEDLSMNAFASGLNKKTYTVSLSRGIINRLSDAELTVFTELLALPDPELFAQLNGQNPAANAESAALLDKIRSSRRTD